MTSDDAGETGHIRKRPNDGRTWTEADDTLLRNLIFRREPPVAIARQLQRTQAAVRGRAGQLGLAVPSPLRPWRKHWGRAVRDELNSAPKQNAADTEGPAGESND